MRACVPIAWNVAVMARLGLQVRWIRADGWRCWDQFGIDARSSFSFEQFFDIVMAEFHPGGLVMVALV